MSNRQPISRNWLFLTRDLPEFVIPVTGSGGGWEVIFLYCTSIEHRFIPNRTVQMQIYRYSLVFYLLIAGTNALAVEAAPGVERPWSRIEFEFDQRSVTMNERQAAIIQPDFQSLHGNFNNQYDQMDARLLYPLSGRRYELGLGLNLRYIQGDANWRVEGNSHRSHYRQTIPAFYADAKVNLPLRGLSAGFEGSHDPASQLLDYRAKLNYQWNDSLGLQGGWQHQQISFDLDEVTQTRIKSEGPFIDFFWRF